MIRIISLNLDFGEKRTLTFPVISRVAIGAFSKKTSTPPSLQVTIDEEPVPLVWLNHFVSIVLLRSV